MHRFVALLCLVVAPSVALAAVYADSVFANILSSVPGVQFVAQTPPMSTETDMYLSSFAWPANRSAQQANYVSVPVAAMALCLASQSSGAINASIAPTMADLGNLLAGVVTGSTWIRSDWVGQVSKVYWAQSSSAPLLNSLKTWRGSQFTSTTAFPTSVTTNPRVTILPTDLDVAAAVAANPTAIGIMPLPAAVQAKFGCLSMTISTTSGGSAVVAPQLQATWATLITVTSSTLAATCPVGVGCYPLIGSLVAHVRRRSALASCTSAQSMLPVIFSIVSTSSPVAAPLRRWSMLLPPTAAQIATLQTLTNFACMPETVVVRGAGGVTPQTAFNDWFFQYFMVTNGTVFVNYNGTSAGDGLTAMQKKSVQLGGGVALRPADRATYPNLHTLPAVGTSIALVVNIGRPVPVTLPRCGITSIFNGTITWWNDTAIQNVNPMTIMPAQPIDVTVRTEPAATTDMLMAGLRWLDLECFGGAVIAPTALVPNITKASRFVGNAAVANYVVATPYSITWVSSDYANNNNLNQASIQASDASITTASKTDVSSAMATGVYNPVTSDFELTKLYNAYPFVGVFSYITETQAQSNCDKYKAATDFMLWTLSSPTAVALAIADLFQPMSDDVRQQCIAYIKASATCDGAALYPQPVVDNSLPSWLIAIVILLSLGCAMVAVIVLARAFQANGRDNGNAPKDESKPIAIAFTDIQNSTGLWALEPEAMSRALDDHHIIIRRVIARHKCYEVKTAGDSFMVAAATADQLARFAMDVQTELFEHEWDSRTIDDAYEALSGGFDANGRDVHSQLGSLNASRLWKGLRVRIGLQIGTLAVVHDKVTTGYDYYGSAVNEAARIEALAHGGQVCASAEFVNALSASVRASIALTDKGRQPLRGVPEPVGIFQLLPPALAARVFPALRVEEDFEDEDGNESDRLLVRDISGDTGSVRTGEVSNSNTSTHRNFEFAVASTLRILLLSCDAEFRSKALKTFGKRLSVPYTAGHDAAAIEGLARRLAGMVAIDVKRKGITSTSQKSSVRMSPGQLFLEPTFGLTPKVADATKGSLSP